MNQQNFIAGLLGSVVLVLPALAQQTTDVGQISIENAPEKAAGAGYIVPEDSPKERSTVTKAAIEQQPASSNIFQLMSRTPGVNAQSNDGTGLFGGSLSIRGFNSDEIGVSVAGVPVNDSGNYAVFPQEYVDPENLQEIDITQGGPDIDQPQGGDVGGAVSVVPEEPTDVRRFRYVQSVGEDNFYKSFFRFDTGPIADSPLKTFISYSHAETDKWKGPGDAVRDHIDAGAVLVDNRGDKFSLYSIFNDAVNDEFFTPTLAQFRQFGRFLDFEPNFPGFPAPGPGAQNQGANIPGFPSATPGFIYNPTNFFKFRVNPFINEIATFTADFKVNDTMRLSVQPYYWNGYGNGGGFATISEAKPAATTGLRPTDLNGDGDKLDTIAFYRPSITSTQRPGVNTKWTWQPIEWDTLHIGLNYDHSRHHQTQPFEEINPDGSVGNVFADTDSELLHQSTGQLVQGRNELTFNDTTVAYGENTAKLLNDALTITTGIKRQEVSRQGNNELPTALATGNPDIIHPSVDYLNYLPELQVGYHVNSENQFFVNLQKSARAPSNFTLYETAFNTIGDQKQETSWDLDVGYRYQNEDILASVSSFAINLQNRQLQVVPAGDPATETTDINAGTSHKRGFEAEIGTAKPIEDFSVYGSITYDKDIQQSNLAVGSIVVNGATVVPQLPTAGKEYPNSPKWLLTSVLSYTPSALPGAFFSLTPKYTSSRYSTLVDDEKAKGYTDFDIGAGYHLPDTGVSFVHNVTMSFNISNLLDRDYLFFAYGDSSNTLSTRTILVDGKPIPGTGTPPTYTVGAPRFFSFKLTADF